jgi:hypothetical protein
MMLALPLALLALVLLGLSSLAAHARAGRPL